jgi:hypothetical protein
MPMECLPNAQKNLLRQREASPAKISHILLSPCHQDRPAAALGWQQDQTDTARFVREPNRLSGADDRLLASKGRVLPPFSVLGFPSALLTTLLHQFIGQLLGLGLAPWIGYQGIPACCQREITWVPRPGLRWL